MATIFVSVQVVVIARGKAKNNKLAVMMESNGILFVNPEGV